MAAVAAIVAAIAAIRTLVYAKEAPTKDDLAKVEKNTAESTAHLRRQTEQDVLRAKVERVPLSVWGQDPQNQNLLVKIKCGDTDAFPTRIDLRNEHGTLFGTCAVVRGPDNEYWTEIDADALVRWRDGGTRVVVGPGYSRLVLRIYLVIEGQEGHRDIAASLTQMQMERDGHRFMTYLLEGAI